MKKYSPTTPSRRNMTTVTYRGVLTASEPHKPLTKGKKRSYGRNSKGRITTQHKGGGHKRLFRDVDFTYTKKNIEAKVETIEYDPNRTAFIALVTYRDGDKRYNIVPSSIKVGDVVMASEDAGIKTGNKLPLKKIPVGTFVFNIETKPNSGGKLVRSAGNYAEVQANDGGYTNVKMPSGEVRKINEDSWATIGTVSNEENRLVKLGKAGRSRWLGIRPTVRGTAMNPVDHPHGGGEGRQGIALRRGPKTRQGKQAYGVKTRRAKKYSNHLIVSRRKTKRNK